MAATYDECYTPGLRESSVAFMANRSVETHAGFFLPHLSSGLSVLDLGCGPGSITAGLAAAVAPGPIIGIDQGAEQLDQARQRCAQLGLDNVRFEHGSCYQIALPDQSVDRVFSHALVEHLADPPHALTEIRRVLRPGGIVGLCSPDWGGFILTPPSTALDDALHAYQELQRHNGGDPLAGRKLGTYLACAGLAQIRTDARYERYTDSTHIASYLATQLNDAGDSIHAHTLQAWATTPGAMFAQAWISATAIRPERADARRPPT